MLYGSFGRLKQPSCEFGRRTTCGQRAVAARSLSSASLTGRPPMRVYYCIANRRYSCTQLCAADEAGAANRQLLALFSRHIFAHTLRRQWQMISLKM